MAQPHRRGLTRIEPLALLACGIILVSAVAVVLARSGDLRQPVFHPLTIKDGAQLRQIHQSLVVFGREGNGRFPRPGLINRLPVNGQRIPGRGQEDVSQNTTANLFSSLIAQNFVTPELLVSPVERNDKVRVLKQDRYDYTKVRPAENVFWDDAFKADLKVLSHVSYAHMPIHGERAAKHWRDTMDSHVSTLGNRGPRDGKVDPKSITNGPELQFD
jgi:hypothetical protein